MPPTGLRVEYLSHDCLIGDDHLDAVTQPIVVDTQSAPGLRFGDRRVLALMQSLCLFALSPTGFRHRDVGLTSRSYLAVTPTSTQPVSHVRPPSLAVTRPHRARAAQP